MSTESTYDDRQRHAYLSSGQTIYGFHTSDRCLGEHCPVHKPSGHSLREFPLRFNYDAFIFERIVPSIDDGGATYIPDPDDYTLVSRSGNLIYQNSARCGKCGEEIVSRSRYDFKTCSCGNLSVDGGHEYIRRLSESGDFVETSIIYEDGTFKIGA